MPTPQEIKSAVNQKMRDILAQLHQKQFVYRAMTGRYWQSKETHSVPPADGFVAVADQKAAAGPDAGESWDQMNLTLGQLEASFRVDCYEGDRGAGYTLTATCRLGADVWTRVAQVGPETHRSTGWVKG